jgi:predicted alpha/beta superfamily hydrolase
MSSFANNLFGQIDTCTNEIVKHEINSQYLNQVKEYWVSLPINYDTTKKYPVIYVLDGQWRFDLVRPIAYDLSGNKKIPGHIVIGLPHKDWKKNRGVDYTFSHSKNEYDNEKVDSLIYNETNTGGGEKFYLHLTEEIMNSVDKSYPTNGMNILIGHSYGGYFGSYILSRANRFKAYQIYDPSIWFSDGESIKIIKEKLSKNKKLDIFISYQPKPEFHASKIEELIILLAEYPNINLSTKKYINETHNSLFLFSFLDGITTLYKDWEGEK